MKPVSREELFEAARGVAAILCDWDGCLAIDNRFQPGVADFLRQARRLAIISNNSTMSPGACRRRLASEGVKVASEHIHLAGHTLLRQAYATFGDQPVHLVANPLMRRQAAAIGLNLVQEAPCAVLVLRDPRFTYAQLARAANHIRRGARFWIANPDLHHPSGTHVVPETGALARAISAVAGREPDLIIGKPGPLLFDEALAALRLAPKDAIMIGDNPATDMAGALAANIPGMLVNPDTWQSAGEQSQCTVRLV